jgi:hypothetical protein
MLLKDWLIDWLVFNANISSISAISWHCYLKLKSKTSCVTELKYDINLLSTVEKTCINRTSVWPAFVFGIDRTMFVLKGGINKDFLHLVLNLKFSLYRISVYSGSCLERLHCTCILILEKKMGYNIWHTTPVPYSYSSWLANTFKTKWMSQNNDNWKKCYIKFFTI